MSVQPSTTTRIIYTVKYTTTTTTAYNVLSIVHLFSARAIQHSARFSQNARSDLARPRAKAPRDSAPRDPRMTRAIAIQTFGSPFSRGSIIDHWNFCRGEVVPSVAPVSATPRGSPLIPVKRELKTCATQRSESPSQRSDPQGPLTRNDADAGVI